MATLATMQNSILGGVRTQANSSEVDEKSELKIIGEPFMPTGAFVMLSYWLYGKLCWLNSQVYDSANINYMIVDFKLHVT